MAKWKVMVPQWETTVEAEDEGYALIDADSEFNFMSEARAEEILPDEDNSVLSHCDDPLRETCYPEGHQAQPEE